MLDALSPPDLHTAAERLGVHPFEVVRLTVMSGHALDGLVLPDERLQALRTFGGFETWWDGAALPDDDNPRRQAIRGVLDAMLERDLVGDRTTRLENLWSGLDGEAREAAERGVAVMVEMGLLHTLAQPSGVQVSVHPDGLDTLRGVVSRGQAPPELAATWND
jgi:hypothetical protein